MIFLGFVHFACSFVPHHELKAVRQSSALPSVPRVICNFFDMFLRAKQERSQWLFSTFAIEARTQVAVRLPRSLRCSSSALLSSGSFVLRPILSFSLLLPPSRLPLHPDTLNKEMNGISPRSLLDTGTSSSSLPQGSSPAAAGSRTLHGDVTSEATRINSNSGAIGSSNGDGKHRRRRSDSPRAGMISGADSLSRGMGDDDGHREDHSGNGLLHANAHGTRGHVGHSHGLGVAGDGVWVRLALLLALSVHSVMEGLGLGARSTNAYNLLFAIGVHKVGKAGGVEAWTVGTLFRLL